MDEIARKDERVKVFHLPADGSTVARSRQAGLDNARGELIAWIDADDYVDSDWLMHQYNALKSQDADIAVCRAKIEDENGTLIQAVADESLPYELYDRNESILAFLDSDHPMNGLMWNKLFRAELIKGRTFEPNVLFLEDNLMFSRIVYHVRKIVRTPYSDYHYMVNTSGICLSQMTNSKIKSCVYVFETIHDESRKLGEMFEKAAYKAYIESLCVTASSIYRQGYDKSIYEGWKYLREHVIESGLKSICETKELKYKLIFLLVYLNIRIPKFVYEIVNR